MNNTLMAALLAASAVSVGAQGHGYLSLDTAYNVGTGPDATAHGLFWIASAGSTVGINQDFNAAFYEGIDPNALSLLATFLLSDGTATQDHGAPGSFFDPTGTAYVVPDYHPYVFMQVQAWTGNFDSYAAAVAGGAFAGESPVFTNMVAYGTMDIPGLVGMPAVILTLPEPPAGCLLLLGLTGLLVRRVRGRKCLCPASDSSAGLSARHARGAM